jgi:hypothetical protein
MLLANSERGSKFQGAAAVVEVNALHVESDQSSSAQIILLDTDNLGCMQSGWHVSSNFLRDNLTYNPYTTRVHPLF